MNSPNRKLLVPEFQRAEYLRQDMIAAPQAGTTLEEMQNPAYWAHVARGLKPHDRIEVRPVDGTWWAELIVRVVEPLAVKVHVLRHVEFTKGPTALSMDAPEGFEFKHRGSRGWCVIRLEDNEVLSERHPDQVAAAAWLASSLHKLAA